MVMANVAWIPYQCRCCGVVVDNHEIRRVLKAGDIMECLQELSGTITDTTVYTTDGRQVGKGLQKPYICKQCYNELEKIVKWRAKVVELESEFKHKLMAFYHQNIIDTEMPCSSRSPDVLETSHSQSLALARAMKNLHP